MFFNRKWHRAEVGNGLTYCFSHLKHGVDSLPDGDSIYCDVYLPGDFDRTLAEFHIGNNYRGYFAELRPHVIYFGQDRNYRRLARSKVSFPSWGSLIGFCSSLRFLDS